MQTDLSRALSVTGTSRINTPTVEQLTIITSFCFAFCAAFVNYFSVSWTVLLHAVIMFLC